MNIRKLMNVENQEFGRFHLQIFYLNPSVREEVKAV
jgi:hypothetical protein